MAFDFLDINTASADEESPFGEKVIPGHVAGKADDVDVGMPTAGSAGDFEDETSSRDVLTPEDARPELAEGLIKESDHARESLLITDVKGDYLESMSGIGANGLEERGHPLADAARAGVGAYPAKSVFTVGGGADGMAAPGTEKRFVCVLEHIRPHVNRG